MRTLWLIVFLVISIPINAQQINRFIVVGDAHHQSPSPDFTQTILYEIALAAIEEKVDFIFFTGDLIVRGFGSPSEEDSVLKVATLLKGLQQAGKHEVIWNAQKIKQGIYICRLNVSGFEIAYKLLVSH